jgi:hypothetical protein
MDSTFIFYKDLKIYMEQRDLIQRDLIEEDLLHTIIYPFSFGKKKYVVIDDNKFPVSIQDIPIVTEDKNIKKE